MAEENFENCNALVLIHEGGYVNHPEDPGGATNKGITQRTYDSWRRRTGAGTKHVKYITQREVDAIYREDYWNPIKGDLQPIGIDYTTYDASVNSGIGRGPKWIQKAIGVVADGRVGPKTLARMNSLTEEETVKALKKAASLRMGFLRGLSHWKTFGRGWTRRVHEVEAGSIGMVSGTHVLREEEKKSRQAASAEAGGAVSTGVGGAGAWTLDIEPLVLYGIAGAVLIMMIIIGRRVVDHIDRAKMMQEVAGRLEQLEDEEDA